MNCPECDGTMILWRNDYECRNSDCRINYLRTHYKRFTVKNKNSQMSIAGIQRQTPTSIFENSSKEVL